MVTNCSVWNGGDTLIVCALPAQPYSDSIINRINGERLAKCIFQGPGQQKKKKKKDLKYFWINKRMCSMAHRLFPVIAFCLLPPPVWIFFMPIWFFLLLSLSLPCARKSNLLCVCVFFLVQSYIYAYIMAQRRRWALRILANTWRQFRWQFISFFLLLPAFFFYIFLFVCEWFFFCAMFERRGTARQLFFLYTYFFFIFWLGTHFDYMMLLHAFDSAVVGMASTPKLVEIYVEKRVVEHTYVLLGYGGCLRASNRNKYLVVLRGRWMGGLAVCGCWLVESVKFFLDAPPPFVFVDVVIKLWLDWCHCSVWWSPFTYFNHIFFMVWKKKLAWPWDLNRFETS